MLWFNSITALFFGPDAISQRCIGYLLCLFRNGRRKKLNLTIKND